MAPSLDWRQGQLNQAADSVRGAVRIALMFDSPKMHGTMMTSIESSLDDFADAECRSHCILSFLGSPPVSESLCEHFLLFGFMTCPVERKPSDRFGQFVAANLRRMMQNRRQVRSP